MLTQILIGLLCLIWGVTWVVIKIGLEDAPPFLSATLRFLFALAVLGIVIIVRRTPHPQGGRTWWRMLWPGVFMYTIPYATVYYASQHIPAALNSILFATFPLFVAVLAHLYLPGERLNPIRWLGLICGFVGVVIIFHEGLSVPDPRVIPAMVIALLSPASAAVASVWIKKHLHGVHSVTATFYQMAIGVAFLLPLGLGWERISDFQWTGKAIGAAAFLGIFGSALTFAIYLHLLKTEEATKMSLVAFVTPLVTLVAAWLVLGERLGFETLLGGLAVLIALYCVLILAPRRYGSGAPTG